MKTNVNICKAKEGFYYNVESGKLEAYQLERIEVDFDSESVVHFCKLGGVSGCHISVEEPFLYKSEDDFRKGCMVPMEYITFEEVFYRAHGFKPTKVEGKDYQYSAISWDEQDGVSDGMVDEYTFIYKDGEWKMDSCIEWYKSREDAYLHHDYTVKLEDGTEVLRRSPKSRVALTDEQRETMKQISELLKKASEQGIQIIASDENQTLYAVPLNEVEDLHLNDCVGMDADVSVFDLVETFSSSGMYACYYLEDVGVNFKQD